MAERPTSSHGSLLANHQPLFPTLASSTIAGITAPDPPPFKFRDDTLIYVIVKIWDENRMSDRHAESKVSFKLKSFKSRVMGRGKFPTHSDVRVIRMPRKEYLKHFARDKSNQYVGTEPEKMWTDQELELRYGKYRDYETPRWVVGRDEGRLSMVEGEENHDQEEDFEWKEFA